MQPIAYEVTPDHGANKIARRKLRRPLRQDMLAIAKDGNAIREREHLVEPVADEDKGRPSVAQQARRREDTADLGIRKRGGRFIQKQHLRLAGDRRAQSPQVDAQQD